MDNNNDKKYSRENNKKKNHRILPRACLSIYMLNTRKLACVIIFTSYILFHNVLNKHSLGRN